MTYPLPEQELEGLIGYRFKNGAILKTALTHSSFYNENKTADAALQSNERLEFLGDSVLSLVVSEYLYENYPERPEGELTKIRAAVVCGASLSVLARKIRLGDFLYLGKGEIRNHGRDSKSILENAFEALLAAIYLDSGCDKNAVGAFLLPLVIPEIEQSSKEKITTDHKTELQQFIQQGGEGTLEYIPVSESGPDHCKVFTVQAVMNGNVIGEGTGHSKREAEQMAAKEALRLFGIYKEEPSEKE